VTWQVAQCQCSCIGGIGRLRQRRQVQACLHHLLDLQLVGPTPPGDGVLDLVGRVLDDLAAGERRFRQGQPARLTDAHRRSDVDLEEHLLDGHHVGVVLGDEVGELGTQRRQSHRQRVRSRRRDHAERDRNGAASPTTIDDGEAAAGQSGVDPEHAAGR
jgi:hypothetical protein